MEADFWHKRWSEGRIGFHQPQANPLLVGYWKLLNLPPKASVFVPLCGKSQDLIWLSQQGHSVQGVELNRHAIEEFDRENELRGSWSTVDGLELYRAGRLLIWHADIFALSIRQTGQLRAIFDRAALIALPPDMRRRYSEHLYSLCAEGCQQLLICLEYDQSCRSGPPFAVFEQEIGRLYSHWNPNIISRVAIETKPYECFDSAYHLNLKDVSSSSF